jgi:3-keto-L-gulonate-6-phosphate decarboxylase
VEQKARPSTSAEGDGRTVLAVVSDLLMEVRIEATAQLQGVTVKTVSADEAATHAGDSRHRLVIADLAAVRDLDALAAAARGAGVTVVAYYPHVDAELKKAAKRAGIEHVYPRSRFLRDLPQILAGRLPS